MLFGVPTMYHRLAGALQSDASLRAPVRDARLLVSGSAPPAKREHDRIERATGQRIVERYGLTETLMNCSVRASGDRRPGYVGLPLPGIELRLVGDDGSTLDVHDDETIGEVSVRGPNLFTVPRRAGSCSRYDLARIGKVLFRFRITRAGLGRRRRICCWCPPRPGSWQKRRRRRSARLRRSPERSCRRPPGPR